MCALDQEIGDPGECRRDDHERTSMGHDEDGGPRDRASVREGSAAELPDLEISSICEHPNARAKKHPPAS